MKSSSYNTSYYLGLDKTVWFVMIAVILLSLGLMGYKKITYEPCIEFSISSKGFSDNLKDHYLIDEDIRFTISRRDAKNVRWNFGDSTEEKGSTIITHSYSHDGKFDVTATINGKCQSITTVFVRKRNPVRNYFDPNSAVAITGSDIAEVNKPAVYMTSTAADSYEWSILNRNEYKTQVGKFAAFNFQTEGKYTLQLKLDNNRDKVYIKEILVKPSQSQINSSKPLPTKHFDFKVLPPPPAKEEAAGASPTQPANNVAIPSEPAAAELPKVEEKLTIEATEKYFQKSFEEVIRGGKPIADFDKYLCNGRSTKVLRNDKDYMTFEELYNDVKGNSKRKIESIQLVKENKCIIMFKVKVKKKNILGVWVDR